MPNFCQPGSDFPSYEEVSEIEREQCEREKQQKVEESVLRDYLTTHPSASRAEAMYKLNTERSKGVLAKTCNKCGKSGLFWTNTDVGWRLRDGGTVHVCTGNT